MARTSLPVTRSSHLVSVPLNAFVNDATNDLQMVNDGHTIILVENTGVVTRNVAFVITNTIDGVTPAPLSFALTAGQAVPFGPHPQSEYSSLLLINLDSTDLHVRAFTVFAPPLS
jgi:hypothetical protein